jgi:hypothetical protein
MKDESTKMTKLFGFSFPIIVATGVLIVSCEKVEMISNSGGAPNQDDPSGGGVSYGTGWLIPLNEVMDGGPGKDGIPALADPELVSRNQVFNLSNNNLVLGIVLNNEPRAYPHEILDWHEIINDQVDDSAYSITYCPLTGSGIAWGGELSTGSTTFGVSGMLYNSNLIPYDRATDSYWSQMRLQCVAGRHIGTIPEIWPVVETTWETWIEMYPSTKAVSVNTGYSRPYGSYPYDNYRTEENLIRPVQPLDRRLHLKERVAGVIVDNEAKVYRFDSFNGDVAVVNDSFMNSSIVAVGSKSKNFIMIFKRTLPDGTELRFSAVTDQLPIVMQDSGGTTWDIFGMGISGPLAGARLPVARSFIAYWFAWGAFYPGVEIYSG